LRSKIFRKYFRVLMQGEPLLCDLVRASYWRVAMNQRRLKLPVPNLDRQRRALTSLVRLVDGCFERAELLKARGWYSFEPYWKFRQSLCSPDDWQIHKQYVVESCKEALGNYRSDFLAALRAEHKVDDSRLTACDRNYLDLRDSAAHRVAFKPFEQEQMRLRRREVELHATSISRQQWYEGERVKRARIWHEVVKETAGPLGFNPNSRLPGRYSTVFRRALTRQWDIALGLDVVGLGFETADAIAKPPGTGPLPIGSHLTWKVLVPAGKWRIRPGDPELIFVPQYFVPFDRAYRNFWDIEGLEINVRADMTALQILWPEMEPKLIEGVSGLQ
jgi:hypothetical protein